MQTAITINGRPLPGKNPGAKADLVYLGSEFCQNLLPGPAEFGRALKAFGKPVVLVTPFLTDQLFPGLEAIIRKYADKKNKLEIVTNDLGLIHLAAKKYSAVTGLSLGRLLADFLKPAPDAFLEKFFGEKGIRRVETDSPELLGRYSRLKNISRTYHIPYSHMAVTRYCPWENHWTGEKCRYTCLGKSKKLDEKRLRRPLRLANCGYFLEDGKVPQGGKIDRIVYSPSVNR